MKETITKILKKIAATPKLINWRFGLFQLMPLHTYGVESKRLTDEMSGRSDVPDLPDLPIHLRDYMPTFRTTKSGGNISGLATPEDFEGLAPSPASIFLCFLTVWTGYFLVGLTRAFGGYSPAQVLGGVGVALLLASIAYSVLGGSPRKAVGAGAFSLLLCALGFGSFILAYLPVPKEYLLHPVFFSFALAPWIWYVRKDRDRGTKLIVQSRKFGGGAAVMKLQGAEERLAMAKQAISEKNSPHILWGTATGALSQKIISPFVSDPGLPLRSSIETLSRHTLILGSSGEGKSALVRGVISQIYQNRGMFASDFKAALPYEILKALHILITPANDCNMLDDTEPTDFNNFLRALGEGKDSANQFFVANGLKIELAAHTILKFATDRITSKSLTLVKDQSGGMTFHNNIDGLFRFIGQLSNAETRKLYLSKIRAVFDKELETTEGKHFKNSLIELELLDSADQDNVGSFFTNALTLFEPFFADKTIRHWAESLKPPVDLKTCFTEQKRIAVAVGDLQGAAGEIYLAMFHQRFKKIAKQLSVDVSDKKIEKDSLSPVLYVIDECASVFKFDKSDGLGDDQMVSIFRSLMVECIFACQSASQLYGRFGHDKVKAFLGNIASVISYNTKEDSTYDLMASRVGQRPTIVRNIQNSSVIDFAETYNGKAGSPIYDENNPNREALLSLHGPIGVKSGYDHGKLEVKDFPVVSSSFVLDESKPALDRATYTRWSSSPRVCFASIFVSGGYRQDFIKPYAVDKDFVPYDLGKHATDANFALDKLIANAEKAAEHIQAGNYMDAVLDIEEIV